MSIEVKAQDVIDQLLAQNRQLVAEIAFFRAALGLSPDEQPDKSEKQES